MINSTVIINNYKIDNGKIYQYNDNQKLNGDCIFVEKNNIYAGVWKEGIMVSGNAVIVDKNGCKYNGEYNSKGKNGYGKIIYNNGEIYEGEWKNNSYNGNGKYIYKNGEIYEGEWKNDKMYGNGKYIYEDGDIYEGEWKNDKMYGYGVMKFKNKKKNKYEGEWENNYMNGKGTLILKNGDICEGNWINDKLNGYGVIIFANGNKYEGNFTDGNFHGKGKYIWKNGSYYEGDWENDDKNGYGELYHHKGEIYKGSWKDDEKNGFGKMLSENGDYYEGFWKNGFTNGKGKIIRKNGVIYEGIFKNNCSINCRIIYPNNEGEGTCHIINNIAKGYGIINYSNNTIYNGDIHDDKPNGFGKLIYSDGNVKIGMWENGKLMSLPIKMVECNICLTHNEPNKFSPYCDYCDKRICNTCFQNYYKKNDLRILTKNHFCCPFCRNIPFYINLDESLIYLIEKYDKCYKCSVCKKYENIIEQCENNGDNVNLDYFRCKNCIIPEGTKECPNCGIYIQKISGCNHIQCRCGYHFCWICKENWEHIINKDYHYSEMCM